MKIEAGEETEEWSKERKTVAAILNERPVTFSEYDSGKFRPV